MRKFIRSLEISSFEYKGMGFSVPMHHDKENYTQPSDFLL